MSKMFLCAEVIWRIENFTCSIEEKRHPLLSKVFALDSLSNNEFFLVLYPRGTYDQDDVCTTLCYRIHSPKFKISYSFEVLDYKNSPQNATQVFELNYDKLTPKVMITQNELLNDTEKYLPSDVLKIRCRIWAEKEFLNDKLPRIFLRTFIPVKKCSFEWNIPSFPTERSDKVVKFQSLFIPGETATVTLRLEPEKTEKYLQVTFFRNRQMEIGIKYDIRIPRAGRNFLFAQHILPFPSLVVNELYRFQPLISREEVMKDSDKYLIEGALLLNCQISITSTLYEEDLHYEYIDAVPSVRYKRIVGNYEYMKVDTSVENTKYRVFLTRDIAQLYQDGALSDFQLQVGSQLFSVHSAILGARSRVLRCMLETNMKEKQDRIMRIDDEELDGEIVKRMLSYIYTDDPGNLTMETARKLYYAGDKYQIAELKTKCADFLKQNIKPENIYELLILADQHGDQELKLSAIEFVSKNEKEILLSEPFQLFSKRYSTLAIELMSSLFRLKLE